MVLVLYELESHLWETKQRFIKPLVLVLLVIPVVAIASSIMETPTLYEQGGMCYYESIITTPNLNLNSVNEDSADNLQTVTPTSTEVGVSVPAECECVRYLREALGVPIKGDAHTIVPNVDGPIAGGVVLFNYNGVYHASYIKWIFPNGNFWVVEGNKEHCAETERPIFRDDLAIRGYWYKNPNVVQ